MPGAPNAAAPPEAGGDHRPAPLAGLRFCLLGPGKVGASLAHWLVAGGARLERVIARRREAAEALTAELGGEAVAMGDARPDLARGDAAKAAAGRADSRRADEARPAVDLLLIAVSDSALDEVVQGLAAGSDRSLGARVALHTAGSRGAEALAPLAASPGERSPVAIGALHPLKAFPRVLADVAEAAGILFALDGDPAALALGRRLTAAWRAKDALVPGSARPLYHFAASLAAGGVVTLLATANRIARLQGLSDEVAAGYLELALGALEATRQAPSAAAAITGPLARGDFETVAAQLAALGTLDPPALPLCQALALETLRHRGLSQEQRRAAASSLGLISNQTASNDTPQ
jgi:predicted short-subunit dehydrogenase-like oxidoreductase (DUF2520 family)